MSTAPYTSDLTAQFDFGGPRSTANLLGVCIHTTENQDTTHAKDVAAYQVRSRSGSYHVIVDEFGAVVLCNTDDWVTWSTGNRGNDVLLHIAIVARASWTREFWLAHPVALESVAMYIAWWSLRYGIPIRRIDHTDLLAQRRGVCGHVDTGRAWGGTDHTDPGASFPYDRVLARAREYATVNPPTTGDHDMTPEQARQLREVWDQLCGPQGKGWPQLGGKTLVDSLVDAHRKLDTIITHLDNA